MKDDDLESKLKELQSLDENIRNDISKYSDAFKEFGESIKEDIIEQIKKSVPKVVDVEYFLMHNPEDPTWKTLIFDIVIDGESKLIGVTEDDKYFDMLFKNEFITKLRDELKSSIHFWFVGNKEE